MGIAGQNHRLRGQLRVASVVAVGTILLGCSGSGTTLPTLGGALPSWFRSSSTAAQAQAQASSPVTSLEDDCPSIDIRTGAGTLAIAKGQQPTANDLRYQLTFGETARQCFVEGGTVRMRVGVQGRAVVGPAGAPPQVNVPIRYAVVQEGVQPKTIVTKFRNIALPIPPGALNVPFTDIEEDLSFPMPSPAELQAYVVYVGFDELGSQQRPAAKKKSSKK